MGSPPVDDHWSIVMGSPPVDDQWSIAMGSPPVDDQWSIAMGSPPVFCFFREAYMIVYIVIYIVIACHTIGPNCISFSFKSECQN